jgi:membrane protein implicated in regulation of membrane protease activity
MAEKGYFLRLTGAFLLGVVALIIAGLVFFLLLPVLIPLALGAFLIVAVFIAIWAGVYVAMVVGVAIYYFFKPMKFEKKDKGYSIAKAKEAGKREKGESEE